MTQNYILEGGISFWDMLNEIDSNDDNNKEECLLTKVPLTRNYIKLDCGHKFNYLALFEEVKQQKTRKPYTNPIKFSYNSQFYCPYCRKIINGLLPYIPDECEEKIKYVNFPFSLSIKHRECSYVYKSGKNKGNKCCALSAYETDNGTYCYTHHNKYSNNKKNITDISDISGNYSEEFNEFYKKHTVNEIKNILKELKLPVSGNKKTIVERYFNYKNANTQ